MTVIDRVEVSALTSTNRLPLLVQATEPDITLEKWITQNRDLVDFRLLEHGGILFRGFDLSDARAFAFLARVSQDRNVKLRLVAQEVIAATQESDDSAP